MNTSTYNPVTLERGVSFFIIKKYIMERFGQDGIKRVSDKLSPQVRTAFDQRATNKWYPIALLKELYQVMDEVFISDHPDFFVELGRFSCEYSIKGFMRYLVRNIISVKQLIQRMGAFWKNYRKGGSIQASEIFEETGFKKTLITVRGLDLIPAACMELARYMEELTLKAGARDVKVEKKACIHKGDKVCTWLVSWKEK